MNLYSSFIRSNNLFNHPPIPYEDFDTVFNYDEIVGIEKYAYNTYRHYALPYITNPKQQTVLDVKCGKGYALSIMKSHYGFEKVIGYNNDQELIDECKLRHSNISFYKDFIMSSQVNANIIFSMNAFNDYDNKSALLLRFRHAIAEEGTLIIIQETNDVNEYAKYESILEKTHGLKQVYRNDISNDVVSAVEKIANKSETLSPRYAHFNEYVNNNNNYRIFVSIFRNI
jgi:trans-aconitate methyltransferase